jgi:hypothetical protein
MSKANRLSITNHATSKDALSDSDEVRVHDELNALLKTAGALIYTSHSAMLAEAEMAGETLSRAVLECLYHAWTQLDQATEKVDRLNSARMWRLKMAEKAHA